MLNVIFKKKLLYYLFVAIIAGNCITASLYSAAQSNTTTDNRNKTSPSLLWEVSGNGLAQPSYLYGTMHSKDLRVHQLLNDSVYAALTRSQAIALELVVKPEEQLSLMKQMFMKDTILTMLYDEKKYNIVMDYIKRKMGNLTFLFKIDQIKPIFLITLLSEMDKDTAAYPQTAEPLDMYLQQWGTAQKKQLIGIETMEEQVAALDAIPLKIQAQMLLDAANEEAKNDSLEQVMMRIYLNQDIDSLLVFYQSEKTDVLDKALVLHRNKNMADRIAHILKEKNIFVAIGALHLPGKNGVIELLRAKGYRVSPIIDLSKHWKPYKNNPQRFEVHFPDKPEITWLTTPSRDQTPIDTVNISVMYSFADTIGQSYYSLVYIPLDSNTVQQSDSAFFIGISERLLLKDNAYMVSEDTTSYNGQPVYEGEIDLGDDMAGLILRFWVLRYKKYAYLLSVTGTIEDIYSSEKDFFFNSFRLKK